MSNRAVAEVYRLGHVFNRRRVDVKVRDKAKTKKRAYAQAAGRTSPTWIPLETPLVELTLVIIGFVLGRASIRGDIFPLGLAFAAAAARTGELRRLLLVSLSVLAGLSMVAEFQNLVFYAAGLAVISVVGRAVGINKAKDLHLIVGVIIADFTVRATGSRLIEGDFNQIGTIIIETSIMGALCQVYSLAVRFWFKFHSSQPVDNEDILAAIILGASTVLGLSGVLPGLVGLDNVVAKIVTILGACIGGPAIGSALGVTVGLASMISGKQVIGAFALGGLIGGSFRSKGKLGVVCGILLSDLIFSMDLNDSMQLYANFIETGLAFLFLLAIPKKWLEAGARLVPGTTEHTDREMLRERRLRELVSKRLKDFSKIFGELSRTFNQGSPVEGTEAKSFNGFLENIVRRSCLQCTGYHVCWQEKLYKSYIMMLDLLALAETTGKISLSDLPDGLHNKCIQPQSLVNAVNGAVEVYQTENLWERRLRESREIVSSQLKGVSRIMSGLAGEIKLDLSSQEEIETNLKDELLKRGVKVDEILVSDMGEGRLDVSVEMPGCGGECLCAKVVAPIAGRTLDTEFSVWNPKCSMGTCAKECLFELVPKRCYDVVTEVIKVPKSGSVVSGDAHAVLDLPGGKIALVLSDGMGGGPRAALESGATINMLRQLMDAGFERDFAIRTINSVLMLRSPEETFSTIDMAIIDLHSGQTEFLKIGSAPSFLKRGKDVRTIKSSTLPVGILNSIEVESCSMALRNGDMLVMVTDGAVEATRRGDKEEWIAGALKRFDTSNPKEIASAIYNMVKKESGKKTADDITILVAKIITHGTQVVADDSGIQTLNTGHYAS